MLYEDKTGVGKMTLAKHSTKYVLSKTLKTMAPTFFKLLAMLFIPCAHLQTCTNYMEESSAFNINQTFSKVLMLLETMKAPIM